jgi:hypothetical protein
MHFVTAIILAILHAVLNDQNYQNTYTILEKFQKISP